VINYQTAVLRGDIDMASKILPSIPNDQRNRIAHFLDAQGLKEQALQVSLDADHRFELAVQLGKLEIAVEIAKEAATEQKWKQLGDLALAHSKLDLAEECLSSAEDIPGLLLLYTSSGNPEGMLKLAKLSLSKGKHNVAFLCFFLLHRLEDCLDLLIETNRIPEAAFLARTYIPSQVSRVVKVWRQDLQSINERAAESLADPLEYENLFPDLSWALKAEKYFKKERQNLPASCYAEAKEDLFRDLIEEIKSMNLKDEVADETLTEAPKEIADEASKGSGKELSKNSHTSTPAIVHEKTEDDFDELSRALEEPLDD